MPKKKIDYTAFFTYDSKRDIYYFKRKGRKYYGKDPALLYEKLQQIEAGAGAEPVIPLFKDVADAWKGEKWAQIRPKTQECYKKPLERAIEEYGETAIDEITAADVNRIVLRMKDQGFSGQTIKDQKSVLNQIFNYAIAHDPPYIRFNPCAAITLPRGLPKTKRKAIEESVEDKVIAAVDDTPFGLFPYLLLFTGLRRGEALGLKWGSIDFKNNEIIVDDQYQFIGGKGTTSQPKTEAGVRRLPLVEPLKKKLVRPKKAKDGDYIFTAPNGKPYSESTFKRHWLKYCREIGCAVDEPEKKKRKNGKEYTVHHWKPTITPHQFRHSYATIVFESGTDVRAAQLWLGHEDIATTERVYQELREAKKQKERQTFDKYMEKYDR